MTFVVRPEKGLRRQFLLGPIVPHNAGSYVHAGHSKHRGIRLIMAYKVIRNKVE